METKLEKNFQKHAILFLALIAVSITAVFGLRRYSRYREVQQQKVWEDKHFDHIFGSIQSNEGRVTLYKNPGGFPFSIPYPQRSSIRSDNWFKGYRSLSEGETFGFSDHHGGMTYKIIRIESDGVLVGYNGVYGSRVKLTWR